jgi:hypothetical protein
VTRTPRQIGVALAQTLIAALLLLPILALVGLASPRAFLTGPALALLAVLAAFPLWVLTMALRAFRRLTPAAVSALRWTSFFEIACGLVLGISGIQALRAAERSAARGGGLLGAFGLLPLALGVLVGVLGLVSWWLLRGVIEARHPRRAP